jgi:hypothetical protein
MYARVALVLAGLAVAGPAMAGEMSADEARRFVIGKMFAFTCFEGTSGSGRILSDGSVAGAIQLRGDGPVHHAALPAGTLQVKGERVCATLRGLPFQPCFNLEKIDQRSFRGSISGLGFAYCDFTRRSPRMNLAHTSSPRALHSGVITVSELRGSLTTRD